MLHIDIDYVLYISWTSLVVCGTNFRLRLHYENAGAYEFSTNTKPFSFMRRQRRFFRLLFSEIFYNTLVSQNEIKIVMFSDLSIGLYNHSFGKCCSEFSCFSKNILPSCLYLSTSTCILDVMNIAAYLARMHLLVFRFSSQWYFQNRVIQQAIGGTGITLVGEMQSSVINPLRKAQTFFLHQSKPRISRHFRKFRFSFYMMNKSWNCYRSILRHKCYSE